MHHIFRVIKPFIRYFPVAVVIALTSVAYGQPQPTTLKSPPTTVNNFNQVLTALNSVANFLFTAFLVLAVIFLIVAALFYLTAAGNQTQLDRAKNVLIYSIVAIVIALIAGGLTNFITSLLGIPAV